MTKKTIIFSLLLIILGLYSYISTDRVSVTALIPTFLGTVIFLCGLLSLSPRFTKHAMHMTVLLAAIGIIGSFGGLMGVLKYYWGKGELANPAAAYAKTSMALMCIWYVLISFNWFLTNRRKQKSPHMIA